MNVTGCTLPSNHLFLLATSVSVSVYPCERNRSTRMRWCSMSVSVLASVSSSFLPCAVSLLPHNSSWGVSPTAGRILSFIALMASSRWSSHFSGIGLGPVLVSSISSRFGAHIRLRWLSKILLAFSIRAFIVLLAAGAHSCVSGQSFCTVGIPLLSLGCLYPYLARTTYRGASALSGPSQSGHSLRVSVLPVGVLLSLGHTLLMLSGLWL